MKEIQKEHSMLQSRAGKINMHAIPIDHIGKDKKKVYKTAQLLLYAETIGQLISVNIISVGIIS